MDKTHCIRARLHRTWPHFRPFRALTSWSGWNLQPHTWELKSIKISFSYPFLFSRELGDPWKHQIESQILKDSMHTRCANSHVVTRVVYREACDHHGSSPCDVRPGSHCLQPSENSFKQAMKSAWNSDEILHKIYKICTVAPSNFYKTRDVTQTLDSEVWAKSICHCFDVLRPACGSSPQASPALSRRWEGLFWWQIARTDK